MKRTTSSILLIFSLICGVPPMGSGQGQQQEKPPTVNQFATTTTGVVLDAVVKDRRGHVVKDLTAEDFEVYEDGVRQKIDTFERVARETGTAVAAAAAPAAKATLPKPETAPAAAPARSPLDGQFGATAVAMVFDRLSPDARNRARESALTYIGEVGELQSYVGVFAINLSLKAMQSYTRDANLVRQAIEKAGSQASANYAGGADRPADAVNRENALASQVTQAETAASSAGAAGGGGAASAGAAAGAASVDLQFAEMTRRSQEGFASLERDQQGYATVNGLLALVNSMRNLPGRKAVVYFSEGIAIPPNVAQQFRSVINAANRANVAIYAVDAAGLRTESTVAQSRDNINAIAARRQNQIGSSRPILGDPLTKQLERNEDLLRSDPQSGMQALAQETGGAFIGDNNNVGQKLKQVDEDLNTYYLLGYSSSNQNYDGKFRQITVKMKRGGLDVQTRKGYYAINTPGYVSVLTYEGPALAAASKPNPPTNFPLQVFGMHFPDSARTLRTIIEVQVPANSFTFVEDKAKKTFATDFSIVALVRDSAGQIVGKLSRQYVLTGPLEQMNATRGGQVLFYKETELPAGTYDIQAIAYDAPSEKASVKTSSVDVVDVNEGKVRMSSIAILQRAEPTKEKSESPFQFGEVMVYPSLNASVKKSATKQLPFYFVVYPAKDAKEPPQLTLQVAQGPKMIANLQLKTGPADATGKIPYANALPIESFAPGTYDMRIVARDAHGSTSRTQSFTIEP